MKVRLSQSSLHNYKYLIFGQIFVRFAACEMHLSRVEGSIMRRIWITIVAAAMSWAMLVGTAFGRGPVSDHGRGPHGNHGARHVRHQPHTPPHGWSEGKKKGWHG